MPGSNLTLCVAKDFDLKRAVCSYGYFLLAPNRWDPTRQHFETRFQVNGRGVDLRVKQTRMGDAPQIRVRQKLAASEQTVVKRSLSRMLRVHEDVSPFHRAYPPAKRRGFGRMFRSPTLFEDMVKTITGCNVTWRNTITMNRLLCETYGAGAFPAPETLANVDPDELKQTCKVGYRAPRIIALAQGFLEGRVDPDWYESSCRSSDEVYQQLLTLNGFGPYAARNVMQTLGFYDALPIDSETYRHYSKMTGHPRKQANGKPVPPKKLNALIEAYYKPYRPYRFLVYWFELWRDYEKRYGDAWTWERDTTGQNFTAAVLK